MLESGLATHFIFSRFYHVPRAHMQRYFSPRPPADPIQYVIQNGGVFFFLARNGHWRANDTLQLLRRPGGGTYQRLVCQNGRADTLCRRNRATRYLLGQQNRSGGADGNSHGYKSFCRIFNLVGARLCSSLVKATYTGALSIFDTKVKIDRGRMYRNLVTFFFGCSPVHLSRSECLQPVIVAFYYHSNNILVPTFSM